MQLIRALSGQRIYNRIGSRGVLGSGRAEHECPAQNKASLQGSQLVGDSDLQSQSKTHGTPSSVGRVREEAAGTSSISSASPLQFFLEDAMSSAATAKQGNAFRRAVCLSFQTPAMLDRTWLERRVRQLLLEQLTRSTVLNLHELAHRLTSNGLTVAVTYPAKPRSGITAAGRSADDPFLVVSFGEEEVVVDATLREHLAVAPSTPSYRSTLATDVPEVFVGTAARLSQLVSTMAAAIQLNFASQGAEVPPWRRKAALLSRWSVLQSKQPLRRQQQQQEPQGRTRTRAQPQAEDTRDAAGPVREREPGAPAAAAAAGTVAPVVGEPCTPPQQQQRNGERDGKVHGGCGGLAPAMVVLGFELGDQGAGEQGMRRGGVALPERVPAPGGLAVLCRGASSAAASCSGASSTAALGGSPLSVFRDV